MKIRPRPLRAVAILPTLLTLGNSVCGFVSVIHAAKGTALDPTPFAAAAWYILLGMVFDALDGRVARMTRSATAFGAQLDSLSDALTFGLAPAFLMFRLVTQDAYYGGHAQLFSSKVVGMLGALYVVCAVMRLARFTVETTPDPEAHRRFKGLPSPAAAGVLATIVLVLIDRDWITVIPGLSEWHILDKGPALTAVMTGLPILTLVLGLLMVSRMSYVHVVNRLLEGHRPFRTVVEFLIVALLAAWQPVLTFFAAFFGYAVSGPIGLLRGRGALRTATSPTGTPILGAPVPPARPDGGGTG